MSVQPHFVEIGIIEACRGAETAFVRDFCLHGVKPTREIQEELMRLQ